VAAPTVVCVLRTQPGLSSGVYKPEHVVHLLAQIERHWPYTACSLRCVVLTDQVLGLGVEERPLDCPWPGWWAKMMCFAPQHNDLGAILYFDLDTVVVGALDGIAAVRGLTMLRDFYTPTALGSGLMLLPAEVRPAVWETWMRSANVMQRKYRGDQNFLAAQWPDASVQRWQDVVPGAVVSYKCHVKGPRRRPAEARVVCFHGRPKPWEVQRKDWLVCGS